MPPGEAQAGAVHNRGRPPVWPILALGCVSGTIALSYEVLWTRELLNLLGSTTAASSIVLAAFMGGLAAGAWVGGRWSEKLSRPLLLYLWAEGLLAGYALAFPVLAVGIDAAIAGRGGSVVLLGGLLLAPAGLMGLALPALAAGIQAAGAADAKFIARLYGLNALGGALAALVIGFATLPALGLAVSERAVAVLGLLASLAAWGLARRVPGITASKPGAEAAPSRASFGQYGWVIAALFLSGTAALGYELLWTRALVLVAGSSSNAFTIMLALYVAGLAGGSLWIGRYPSASRLTVRSWQYLQIGIAGSALIGVALIGALPTLALGGYAVLGTSAAAGLAVNLLLASVVIIPPTLLMGASLPLAARLLERERVKRGRELGTALAALTAGNVVGVFLAGRIVIPWLGLHNGIAAFAMLNIAAALLPLALARRRDLARIWSLPVAALGVLLVLPLLPAWNPAVMSSGVFRHAPLYLSILGGAGKLERAFAAYRTRYYEEGSEAVVAVFDRPTLSGKRHRVLTIDGKVDASTGADMPTQILSGQLPFLFAPQARRALLVGLASGVTAGALLRHSLDRLDVVEIEPAVVAASRFFNRASGAPLEDPRTRVIIADGRRYLRHTARRYDVIVSEPSNPWLSMSARLFTRSFFESVRSHLSANGVFIQWVPLYSLSTVQFQALLRTLLGSFAHAALFQSAAGDLLVVAGPQPLAMSRTALRGLFAARHAAALDGIGIATPVELLARWVADGPGLRSVIGRGVMNTDDNGLLELGSPWHLLDDTAPANLDVVRRAGTSARFIEAVVEALSAADGFDTRMQQLARRYLTARRPALAGALAAVLRRRGADALADLIAGDAAGAEGRWTRARRLWRRHASPAFRARRARLAFRRGDSKEVVKLLAPTPSALRTPGGNLLYALSLAALDRSAEALRLLDRNAAAKRSVAGIIGSFVTSSLAAQVGRTSLAERTRDDFHERLDDLRRCLEVDDCREVLDTVLRWSRERPHGFSVPDWERLRQALYVHILRPMPVYYEGVSKIWLGEREIARTMLKSYRALLPRRDPASRVHALLAGLGR